MYLQNKQVTCAWDTELAESKQKKRKKTVDEIYNWRDIHHKKFNHFLQTLILTKSPRNDI